VVEAEVDPESVGIVEAAGPEGAFFLTIPRRPSLFLLPFGLVEEAEVEALTPLPEVATVEEGGEERRGGEPAKAPVDVRRAKGLGGDASRI